MLQIYKPSASVSPCLVQQSRAREPTSPTGLRDAKCVEQSKKRWTRGLFRLIADQTYDWESWIDPQGRLCWVNPAVERFTGISVDACEAMVDYPLPLIAEADRARIATLLEEARGGTSGNDVEFRLIHADGSTRWVAMSWQPLMADDGHVLGCRASFRDITERKGLQEQLTRAQAKLEESVECRTAELHTANASLKAEIAERQHIERERDRFFTMSFDLLAVFGLDRRIRQVNPAVTRCLGWTSEEMVGRSYLEFSHPDDIHRCEESMLQLARGKIVVEFELRMRDTHGSWRHISWTSVPVAEDQVVYTVGRDVTEHRNAEAEICSLNARLVSRLDRIDALRRIDRAIVDNLDVRTTLAVVLDEVISHLGIDAAGVFLREKRTQHMVCAADRGYQATGAHREPPLDSRIARTVAESGKPLFVPDLRETDSNFPRGEDWADQGFVTFVGVPLVARSEVIGVLEVFQREPIDPDPEWFSFLETLAGQAAVAIDKASLSEDLQRANENLNRAYDATIEGWARALDLRDHETEGHSRRVTRMSVRLAEALGLEGDDIVQIRRGALLHDIGKMGIPDAILSKPGPLDEREMDIVRQHPRLAYEMLAPIAFLSKCLDIPYCHHERWDGTGYPRGMMGEAIPLSARIFAAVDIWDALSNDRVYRSAWPPERVREHLRSLSGTHLDPTVVAAFLEILDRETLKITLSPASCAASASI